MLCVCVATCVRDHMSSSNDIIGCDQTLLKLAVYSDALFSFTSPESAL